MRVTYTRPSYEFSTAVGDKVEEEMIALANAWDRTMVQNDAEAIGRYLAVDWTIVGPDGSKSD